MKTLKMQRRTFSKPRSLGEIKKTYTTRLTTVSDRKD